MRVLITGVTGFAGSHLVDLLLGMGDVEVYGIYRWRSRMENLEHLEGKITLLECDIRDSVSVLRTLSKVRPDRIFHLAAQSFVPTSWEAPEECLSTNIEGELHVFEAVRTLELDTRIQLACSSEEYGLVLPEELPIKETNPLRPLSPYGVSKVSQDMLGYQYFQSYNMFIVRTRGFNHTGPRRASVFVCSDFARQIVRIERKEQEPYIFVGNLEAKRDFTDVRDMVRGYWLALDKGEPGEVYNICSGTSWRIRDILDKLIEMAKVKIEVRQDKTRMRPSDVPLLEGDHSKFHARTGWKPEIPFEKTLSDLLDYWRQR